MKKSLLFAAALALSTTVYAAEDETATQQAEIHAQFMKLDASGDGAIDATEAKADPVLDLEFNTIATDGKVDEKTYGAWVVSKQD